MKILHILDHSIPLHSGYTFRTKAILEQQKKLGWQTFQVTSAKQGKTENAFEDIEDLRFYRSQQPSKLLNQLPVIQQWAIVQSLAQRLDELIPELKPDILHAHSPALNGLAALKAGKKFNIPVVYECRAFWEDAAVDHGTTREGSLRYRLTHWLETSVFKQADAITTICEGLRNDIVTRGIPMAKVTVIPNAVDITHFAGGAHVNQQLKTQLGLQDKLVLGFIGSFYAYEGLPLLLKALPAILEKQPSVRFLLVGGGPQESLLQQIIRDQGLAENVICTGRVPHNQVQDYYNLVDIFVYPRLAMRLTDLVTPLKPLEAMAQGRLVVASDVGGHQELIRDQKTGFLFEANNADSLAQTILHLLEQRSEWQLICETARNYVESERNWQTSVANYQEVYQNALKARQ